MKTRRCPIRKELLKRTESFPSCSARCKLVDVGNRFGRIYRIAVERVEPTGGGELMKYTGTLIVGILLLTRSANAQTLEDSNATSDATPEATTPAEPAPTQQEEAKEDDRSPYYKKVRGWLWLEGVAGVASYDPDQFGTLKLGSAPNAPKQRGPQYGFAVGTGFGGPFFLGWYYRRANFGDYKLMRTGAEFQPTIRIPHVHIALRLDIGLARIVDGNPYGFTDVNNGGLDFTAGVGLRIPIVRWISIAATFDWSYIGLSMRGTDSSGVRQTSWINGQQLAGTFALTFHFIGVRKD